MTAKAHHQRDVLVRERRVDLRLALLKLLDLSIPLFLLITMATLTYGHAGSEGTGLSLQHSYISEYMKMAPHWPWLIVGSFSFAILLSLLAIAVLLRRTPSPWSALACLLLAMTAMANFFVAYSPVRRVPQPAGLAQQWWTPTWWFTSATATTPYEEGMADAYSDVHYRATRLAVVTGIVAVLCFGLELITHAGTRSSGGWSIAAVLLMSAFFLMGDHLTYNRGLWQRLGFLVFYSWLWVAWRVLAGSRNLRSHETDRS